MEKAPLPLITPKEYDLSKLNNIKYIIKDKNNQTFNISFYLKENSIFIKGNEENDITNSMYVNEMNLEDFQKLNKFFKSSDNISEIYETIKEIEKEDFSIDKRGNILELNFNIQVIKKKIIVSINLNQIINNIESIVMNLCEKVKEVDTLKEEIKNYKNEIGILKNEMEIKFKNLSLKLDNIEEENKKLKEKIETINNIFESEIKFKKYISISNIIDFPEEFQLINNGIKERFNKEIKTLNLLYRASKDGGNLKAFQSKCLNINDTLILVKTKEGKKFGGFTHENWPTSQKDIKDEFAFIFSLNNKEIYKVKNPSQAISYCNTDYMIRFGNKGSADFAIYNNCMSNESSYERREGSSYDFKGKEYPLNGKSNFRVNELEVFSLGFE